MTKIEAFFEDMKHKQVVFIGAGVSHRELILLFRRKGIPVTLCDKREASQLGDAYEQLKQAGVSFCLGEGYEEGILKGDVIFRTPGMYYYSPVLTKARELQKVVTSEMEVFFDLCPCKIYAVTGSDGKTTTTTLISELLKAEGKTVYLGGNIGKALLPLVEEIRENDAAVVELSSFQLISMRRSPDVAVITNVAPNHLDVHKNMQEYIDAKRNLILHQNAFSKTVLNADNEVTRGMEPDVRGALSWFSRKTMPQNGAFLAEDGNLCLAHNGQVTTLLHKDRIRIPGIHNVENYLAAIAATAGEVSPQTIVQVAEQFGGVEHRIEFVRTLDGVRYYNDSIATSPTRTIAGLNSFDQKLIVLAGGYDKKIPFEPLAPELVRHAKVLILMGVTAQKIKQAVTSCEGYDAAQLPILEVSSMEEAVQTARKIAQSGDVVTLSPACASFDMYPNFEARGRHYKALVNALV